MFKTQNLYQNDPRWKDKPLGLGKEKIGSWGCLLTSITMMLNGAGYNETPDTVNDKMKANGGFQGAFFIPSALPYVFPNVAYRGIQPCENSPAPIALIDAALDAGRPVILQVDWSKDAGIQTHFVLVKERKGDDYSLYDPYMYRGDGPDKEVLLTQRYKYQGAKIDSEISGVLWWEAFGVTASPPETKKVSVPAEKFTIYAAEDDLALRNEPSPSGYLWKRMLGGTPLISLEAKATAQAKIGQQGQWLQVQDPDGQQGYVAAWYTSTVYPPPQDEPVTVTDTATATTPTTTPATSATQPAAPAKVPAGALAFYPTEELSFRTQPVVSPSTLIRRVPVTEQLISVEGASKVVAKVGVEGQWLKVRDASNKEGFVAAWYVKYASGSAAQAQTTTSSTSSTSTTTTTTPAATGPVKVKATAEGIALRSQPVVSDTSLIKRLPINTVFTLLEPGAETKIGKNDQWLKVKDPSGKEGYVAAWFVAR